MMSGSTKVSVKTGTAFKNGPRGYCASYDLARDKVRVWDTVAGHWTTCHDLSPAQVRYVKARIRAVSPIGDLIPR